MRASATDFQNSETSVATSPSNLMKFKNNSFAGKGLKSLKRTSTRVVITWAMGPTLSFF